jgi:hypothetical protein
MSTKDQIIHPIVQFVRNGPKSKRNIGLLMASKLGNVVYITASKCRNKDVFDRREARRIAQARYNRIAIDNGGLNTYEIPMSLGKATVKFAERAARYFKVDVKDVNYTVKKQNHKDGGVLVAVG